MGKPWDTSEYSCAHYFISLTFKSTMSDLHCYCWDFFIWTTLSSFCVSSSSWRRCWFSSFAFYVFICATSLSI